MYISWSSVKFFFYIFSAFFSYHDSASVDNNTYSFTSEMLCSICECILFPSLWHILLKGILSYRCIFCATLAEFKIKPESLNVFWLF